ncbi:MAG: excinuclease ABC subunit UvrC [Alphaproteobacteria bacterium]
MQDSDTHLDEAGRAPENGLRGFTVIENQLKTLPGTPGVYRMVNAKGDVLYVGKARNLKKRVASYASPVKLSNRIQRMVAETASLEVISTHTEVEALLLESNLIKKLRPRYNVILRDDKSFPYILITADHAWPRVTKYRGARSAKGEYYGPFASAGAVNRTLNWLERAFLLRSCADTVFATRTRPCLLHQIKRCSAPCVGRIAPEDYAALVAQASSFLGGRSQEVQRDLSARMQAASDALDFETAAAFRDRIRALTQIQAHQGMNLSGLTDADVIAAHAEGDQVSVQVFFFRAGNNNGNRAYFPRHDRSMSVEDVLGAFIGQFYDNKIPPPLVLLSHAVPDQALLAEALSVAADRKVELSVPARGDRRKMMEHALLNARDAMARHLSESATQRKLLEGVADAFGLDGPPQRIEVYDNSHIMGTNAYGAMIVAGPEGLMKNAYRKFAIRSTQAKPGDGANGAETAPGDDYGMMREVLTRRFTRALKEDPERDQGLWPDLVVIDGGLGQLGVARKVLADLGVDDVALVGIAKGPDRNAGRETFHLPDRAPFTLEPRDPILYFMQRLRDEAHRFAIGAHRAKRSKALGRSALDEIPGIGARRKRALLHHFGSARGVERAGLEDLEAVPGVSGAMAKKIYDHFHGQG